MNNELKNSGTGRALICGSVAYDTIMVFGDRFANHILPDKIHMLNVSFLVPQLRREFGGCAGNIAYNLKLLGDTGVPMAVIGGELAAQAFLPTDLDLRQIAAFQPGAIQPAHANKVPEASRRVVRFVAA